MKLLIQIPCLNETGQLPETLAALPRQLPGIDSIEVLVIDDGSTDGTAELAQELGVHHVIRFARNRGLAAAWQAGIRTCLALGADIVVNTDADNQYAADDIARLIRPLLDGDADLVVGDRQTDRLRHFSLVKRWLQRWLQRWGTRLVRRLSGVDVRDATSGFRALNRRAMLAQFVHNRFSYTLEALIQAGSRGLTVVSVPVRVNPQTRPSRLFRSVPQYLQRSLPVILSAHLMYRPARTFGLCAVLLLCGGTVGVGRFLWFYVLNPSNSGHVQSLVAGGVLLILAFLCGLLAALGELLATERRLVENALVELRSVTIGTRRLPAEWEYASTDCPVWCRNDAGVPSQRRAVLIAADSADVSGSAR